MWECVLMINTFTYSLLIGALIKVKLQPQKSDLLPLVLPEKLWRGNI